MPSPPAEAGQALPLNLPAGRQAIREGAYFLIYNESHTGLLKKTILTAKNAKLLQRAQS